MPTFKDGCTKLSDLIIASVNPKFKFFSRPLLLAGSVGTVLVGVTLAIFVSTLYSPTCAVSIVQHSNTLKTLLGSRADALRNLIALLSDLDRRQVEAVATLYAVWNDALMDGQQPSEATIINGVLTDWHEDKGEKFTDADLRHWLQWMQRNGLVPGGKGPRTTHTMTRDMFS